MLSSFHIQKTFARWTYEDKRKNRKTQVTALENAVFALVRLVPAIVAYQWNFK